VVERIVFELVGREEELACINAFVDEVHDGHTALLLEGEPGIGKSTLWLSGCEYARQQGHGSSRRDRPRPSATSAT
jgi:DNA replication protein DnaC